MQQDIMRSILDDLWSKTRAGITTMGRSENLYRIEPRRCALLIIDMQNAFCAEGACIEIPAARRIVANINRLAEACRGSDIPVIWITSHTDPDRNVFGIWHLFQPASPISRERKRPPIALLESDSESAIFADLEVDRDKDHFVTKHRYSAFIPGASKLSELLDKLRRDCLIITGTATDVCCESTARDAMMLNYEVTVVSDATAAANEVFHEISLMHIQSLFGDVKATNDVLLEISSPTSK